MRKNRTGFTLKRLEWEVNKTNKKNKKKKTMMMKKKKKTRMWLEDYVNEGSDSKRGTPKMFIEAIYSIFTK